MNHYCSVKGPTSFSFCVFILGTSFSLLKFPLLIRKASSWKRDETSTENLHQHSYLHYRSPDCSFKETVSEYRLCAVFGGLNNFHLDLFYNQDGLMNVTFKGQ